VDVGVGHEHDLVVPQLGDVELLADAGTEGGDERLDLLVAQCAVQAGLLDVEDLAAQREDRLCLGVAALDRGAAGGVSLDDEDLRAGRVAARAVLELSGHRGGLEGTLAPRGLAGLARGETGSSSLQSLADDVLRLVRVRVEPVPEVAVDDLLDVGPRLGVAELGLRLALELGLTELDRDDRGEALADVVTREVLVLVLEDALVLGVPVDQRGERGAEALLV